MRARLYCHGGERTPPWALARRFAASVASLAAVGVALSLKAVGEGVRCQAEVVRCLVEVGEGELLEVADLLAGEGVQMAPHRLSRPLQPRRRPL